jgi:hypothetical protein
MPVLIQPSFAAGMLSPRLRGRVDLQQYPAGAEDLTNAAVQTQGGASKRPGSYYIAPPGTNARVRLVPFVVSSAVSYVLEFGDEYLRFHRNRAQLLAGTTPLEVETPWTLAQLRALKFAQSADVLYIFHPAHQPRKLSRTGTATFALAPVVFENGPFDVENTGDVGASPPTAAETDPEDATGSGSAGGSGTGDGPDPGGTGSGGGGGEGGGSEGGEAEAEGGEAGAGGGGGLEG